MRILRKILPACALLLGFLWDLLASSMTVAGIVLSPRVRTEPGIIVMPVVVRQGWAVALLAYCTSLTPGSVCLHVSDDRRRLYLHVLDARDPEKTIARFHRIYERWIRELER